jgi:hypothetical protein
MSLEQEGNQDLTSLHRRGQKLSLKDSNIGT